MAARTYIELNRQRLIRISEKRKTIRIPTWHHNLMEKLKDLWKDLKQLLKILYIRISEKRKAPMTPTWHHKLMEKLKDLWKDLKQLIKILYIMK